MNVRTNVLGISYLHASMVFLLLSTYAHSLEEPKTPIKKINITLEAEYAKGFYYSQMGEHTKAFEVMHTLAHRGYGNAQHNLALSYTHGLGTTVDKLQAEYWFKRAHSNNITHATVELANIMYAKGETTKAVELWQYAATQDDEYALFNLAMVLLEQERTDHTKAKEYLMRAEQLGHPDAKRYIQHYF